MASYGLRDPHESNSVMITVNFSFNTKFHIVSIMSCLFLNFKLAQWLQSHLQVAYNVKLFGVSDCKGNK